MALTPASSHGAATTVATDTIWDAKGDTVAATGADAASRVAVGSDGTVYTADSASSAGVKWAAASSGALTLLSTTTLSGDGTFDVASISGSYNDLILVLIARSTAAAVFTDGPLLRFNNDSGTNYNNERLPTAGNSAPTGAEQRGGTAILAPKVPAASSPSNSFGVAEFTVFGYASATWMKHLLWTGFDYENAANAASNLYLGGGLWLSTAAITRVQVVNGAGGNLLSGSQLRIYGRL